MVNENVSLVISRQILNELCNQLPNMGDGIAKDVAHFVLEKVQPRVISFEEQVGKSQLLWPFFTIKSLV